eukprot:Partr_v1_DN27971_c0_g1_i2_m11137 putative vacuolar protein sorting
MDWSQLQDKFYRKIDIGTFARDLPPIDQHRLVCCPDGGPVAIIRDDRQLLVPSASTASTRRHMGIYSASGGELLAEFKMSSSGGGGGGGVASSVRLLEFGWIVTGVGAYHSLACVFDDGAVRVHSLDGHSVTHHQLPRPNLIAARVWSGGVVALTSMLEVVQISLAGDEGGSGGRVWDRPLTDLPSQWLVIPPALSRGRQLEVLFAVGGGRVLQTDGETVSEVLSLAGSGSDGENGGGDEDKVEITSIALSPNGQLIALYATDRVLVYSSDFKQRLLDFSSRSHVPPLQMVFCGDDSVVVYWEQVLLMIGPHGDWVKYSYDADMPVHLHTERDGLRIVSRVRSEFLQRVPVAVDEIFRFGSTTPAALLFDAWSSFERKDSRADEVLRAISSGLAMAINSCVDAAGHEFDTAVQRSLLKAAAFGRAFLAGGLSSVAADGEGKAYESMCRHLRVINALRHQDVGLALTIAQYRSLDPAVIIDYLLCANMHLMALKVSEWLSVPVDRVLVHWACEKMKDSMISDEVLEREIVDKLQTIRQNSWSQISRAAHKSGRPVLAALLIDHETRIADQLPLLLSMQEYSQALTRSIASGDAELVYGVIFNLRRKLQSPDFLRLIASQSTSAALLKLYLRQRNPELLRDLYYQEDVRVEHAVSIFSDAMRDPDVDSRSTMLKTSLKMIVDDKMAVPISKIVDESIHLLALQRQFTAECKQPFLDLTLNQTVKKLLILNRESACMRLKNDFKIPERRWWFLKVEAYSDARDFDNLEKLARSKRSPIGYEPFVRACMRHQNLLEAKKYVLKMDSGKRAEMYMRIGAHKESAENAYQTKNVAVLRSLREKSVNSAFNQELDGMINSLRR